MNKPYTEDTITQVVNQLMADAQNIVTDKKLSNANGWKSVRIVYSAWGLNKDGEPGCRLVITGTDPMKCEMLKTELYQLGWGAVCVELDDIAIVSAIKLDVEQQNDPGG